MGAAGPGTAVRPKPRVRSTVAVVYAPVNCSNARWSAKNAEWFADSSFCVIARYRDDSWDPRKEPIAMRTLERYWLHTATEWFAVTRLGEGKQLLHLWRDFYSKAILGALRNEPLRITLYAMLHPKPGSTKPLSSFSGFRDEFGEEMEALYKIHYHKDLGTDLPPWP